MNKFASAGLICAAVFLSTWNECLYSRTNRSKHLQKRYDGTHLDLNMDSTETSHNTSTQTKDDHDDDNQADQDLDNSKLIKASVSPPFSTLDPVADLKLYNYDHRPDFSSPGQVFSHLRPHRGHEDSGSSFGNDNGDSTAQKKQQKFHPLPTNSWYQNMLQLPNDQDPTDLQSVYTIPYMINTIGPVPGIQLHHTRLVATDLNVQVVFQSMHGLTIGGAASFDLTGKKGNDPDLDGWDVGVKRRYEVDYNCDCEMTTKTLNTSSYAEKETKAEEEEVETETDGNTNAAATCGNANPLTALGLTLKWDSMKTDTGMENMDMSREDINQMEEQQLIDEDDGTEEIMNSSSTPSQLSSFVKMTSSIVRGMPYGTMHYHYSQSNFGTQTQTTTDVLPTIVSQIGIAEDQAPLVHIKSPDTDGEANSNVNIEMNCSDGSKHGIDEYLQGEEILVEKSVELYFEQSDFTWLVFYSQPVYVRCYKNLKANVQQGEGKTTMPFVLQVTRLASDLNTGENGNDRMGAEEDSDENKEFVLTSRIALMNACTRGRNPSHCDGTVRGQQQQRDGGSDPNWNLGRLLRDHAHVYPGSHTAIRHEFLGDNAHLTFDWDARRTLDRRPVDENDEPSTTAPNESSSAGLLMYSLPHHREIMLAQSKSYPQSSIDTKFCASSLNGDACIVQGSTWVLKEDLYGTPSFFAPRPPMASVLPKLTKALMQDIEFRVPEWFARGAGDTYFSGKILAKLARILTIYSEVKDICHHSDMYDSEYKEQCELAMLPSTKQFEDALDHLRNSTEVWINGKAETPFVYDSKWGGLVSCGCDFNESTKRCNNMVPNCPALSDPGLDFGHGFYNDHHFHQGYFIYAAATVAFFDEEWGRRYFENILLLIRDFANPSPDDAFFPLYRMKDWYLGNSWAGGIGAAMANGRNQESSSESIAAYEAISLFGSVMERIWARNDKGHSENAATASHLEDIGRLLLSTEVRSADRYWHVRQEGDPRRFYPVQYKPSAVGILWNTLIQFQTWFGGAPYLAIGIQLLPLTPISEQRDEIGWAKQLYPSLAESCGGSPSCHDEGWGILQYAILATVGHPHDAISYAESLKPEVFTTAGGNGHSLTNTIWYYSTRPKIDPLILTNMPTSTPTSASHITTESPPGTSECPPCSVEICKSTLNQCPVNMDPFLCTDGPAIGGCSANPWVLDPAVCNECCKLSVVCF